MTPVDSLPLRPTALSRIFRTENISSPLHMSSFASNPSNFQNKTISEPEYLKNDETNHYHGTLAVVLLSVSMVIFMIFAIVGNTLVILTIIRHKGMKTRTNMFITNLAVADILVSLFNMPFSLATVIYGGWIFGDVFCQFNGFVVPLFFIVSIHTLIYISIHKYISITRPFSHTMTPRKILAMIAATWIWAIICSTATLIGGNHVVYKKGASQCGPSIPDELNEYIHSLIITTCNYIVPLIVMSFCYYNIFKEIHGHMIRIRETSNIDLQNSLQQQRRISFTLFLVLACFVVCWTPFIWYSCKAAFSNDKISLLANPVAYWCGYMNSACNPIIYALRSPSFRQGYKEIICSQGTYVGVSTVTRPSLSPFSSLHGKSRKRLSDRAVVPIQSLKLLKSPTHSVPLRKKIPLKNKNWSSFPSLNLRSLMKSRSKISASGNSPGNIPQSRKSNCFEHSHSNHASVDPQPVASENKYLANNCPFRRATSMPLITVVTDRSYDSSSIGHTSVFGEMDKSYCTLSFRSEDNICSDQHKGAKPVSIFCSVGKVGHEVNNTGGDDSCQKNGSFYFPLVVINDPSPVSSNELCREQCSEVACSEASEHGASGHFATLNCLSRSCSDQGSPQDPWDAGAQQTGSWSPISVKSLEMGRNRRRSSKISAKKAELSPLTKKEPESPLYSASREQLMKWMSQDCLDRLEIIEKDFSKRFVDNHNSTETSTQKRSTRHKNGKFAFGRS